MLCKGEFQGGNSKNATFRVIPPFNFLFFFVTERATAIFSFVLQVTVGRIIFKQNYLLSM